MGRGSCTEKNRVPLPKNEWGNQKKREVRVALSCLLVLATGLTIQDFARGGTSGEFPGFQKRRHGIWSQLDNDINHVANF
jgi:hypothetical protein